MEEARTSVDIVLRLVSSVVAISGWYMWIHFIDMDNLKQYIDDTINRSTSLAFVCYVWLMLFSYVWLYIIQCKKMFRHCVLYWIAITSRCYNKLPQNATTEEKRRDLYRRIRASNFLRRCLVFLLCVFYIKSHGIPTINFFVFCAEIIAVLIEERQFVCWFITNRILDCSHIYCRQ